MRLEGIKVHNIGPFKDVELDLVAVDDRLVAIVGDNGEGKSTLLELFLGVLHRACPTRGTLASLATARDAFVEARVVNGSAYVVRQGVDAISGKGESLVLDAGGSPVLESTKVSEYDAWAERHVIPRSVMLCSAFAAQGSEGLIDLKEAARKTVFLRALQVERLEAMAELARERARDCKAHVATLRARMDDARARTPDRDVAAAALDVAEQAAREAEQAVADAQLTLDRARAALSDVARARELADQRKRVLEKLRAADERLNGPVGVAARIANNRMLIDRAAELHAAVVVIEEHAAAVARDSQRRQVKVRITVASNENHEIGQRIRAQHDLLKREDVIRAAAARLLVLDQESVTVEADRVRAMAELADAERAEKDALRRHSLATQRQASADARIGKARARLADRDAITAAGASLPGLRGALERAEADVAHTEQSIAEMERGLLVGKDVRITDLRSGLDAVVSMRAVPSEVAREALQQDDEHASAAERAPAAIVELRAKLVELRRDVALAGATLRQAEQLAARASEIATADEELAFATEDRQHAVDEALAALAEAGEYRGACNTAAGRAKGADYRLTEIAVDADDLRPDAALVQTLDQAHARLEELEPQFTRTAEEMVALQAEHDAIVGASVADAPAPLTTHLADAALVPKLDQAQARIEELQPQAEEGARDCAALKAELATLPDTEVADVDIDQHEAFLAARTSDLDAARQAVASAAANCDAARKGAAFLEQLAAEVATAESELADWTRLGLDLGKDGLQALEIDAAIPELNTIANDLLHSCHGSRFTIDVRTDRVSGDGKRMLEDLDIRVIDTVKGREDAVETYSGGERVIIGEALSLALTTIACRRAGLDRPTIFRDESGAALDPVNARAYVAMLRRAAEHIGADKVLLVSHSPEVQELCDARITVANGGITVSA